MPHPTPIQPVAWSPVARARLAAHTGVKIAAALDKPIHPATMSRWCQGRTLTPEGRIKGLVALLTGGAKRLTPADLGRPDLTRKGGAK
jgi:hypothetical protein